MKSILFIVKNKNEASSRFRVFAYFPYFLNDFRIKVFYAEYNNKNIPKIFRSIIKRIRFLLLLISIKKYDIIFMQRPMSSDKNSSTNFEYIMSKLNPNIIFDFDDALFIQNKIKIQALLNLSHKVICGNKYLADYALKYNKRTVIIPTTTDIKKFIPLTLGKDLLTIGWTGTSGNYTNFTAELIHTLDRILSIYSHVNILFICDKKPPSHFNFQYTFIKWSDETEVVDLQKIDIGIMPLKDSAWTRGKCGFKLIQYGAIGIASIGSNVGVNNQVIIDNKTGLLINNENEWFSQLKKIIDDKQFRNLLGNNARNHITKNYSTSAIYPRLFQVLNS
jgi:hypothetical protein